jgi:hypothetical protein
MLSGIALALSGLPLELIARHGLERRIYERGGEREVQFLFADAERLLPVWRDGRLEVLCWGNRRGESSRLPYTGWTQMENVEDGGWGECGAEPVVIPASMGLDKGFWYRISAGTRAAMPKRSRSRRGRPGVVQMSRAC